MKKSTKIILAGGVAVILLGGAGLAAACKYNDYDSWHRAGYAGWGPGYRDHGHWGHGRWGPGRMSGMMGCYPGGGSGGACMLNTEKLSTLKPTLNLTEAQEPSWDSFVSAVDQFQTTRQAMHDQMGMMMMRGDASRSDRRAIRDTMREAHTKLWNARTALAGRLTDDQLRVLGRALMPNAF